MTRLRRILEAGVLAALAAGSLNAQAPTLSQVVSRLDGRCLQLSFHADVGSANSRAGMYIGSDPDPSDELSTPRFRVGRNGQFRTVGSCSLPSGRRVYVQPFATDAQNQAEGRFVCSEACAECDLGAGPTALSCGAPGEAPYVDTDPSEGVRPPAEPVHAFDAMKEPETDGQTFAVTCADGVAVDFLAKLAEAAAADGSRWHRLEVPSGCTVRDLVQIPPRADGPGGVVITTAGDPRLFPPEGVRSDPSYRGKLARFEASGDWALGGLMRRPISQRQPVEGYRFQNIEIARPDFRSIPVRRLVISGVEVANRSVALIATEPVQGVGPFDRLLLDVQGCNGLQGLASVFRVEGNRIRLGGKFTVTGSCSGGTATQAVAWELESCTSGPNVTCRTSEPHGIPRLEQLEIASIEDRGDGTSTATLAAPMHNLEGNQTTYLLGGDVVIVEASGSELDGRLTRVRGRTNTTVRLDGSAQCASECGTLREIHPIQIFDTGDPGLDGSRHFLPVDERTIAVLGANPAGSTAQGFLTYDPSALGGIDLVASKRIVFDRVLLDCGSFPYRIATCIQLNRSQQTAVVNSYIRGRSFWLPMDPVTKSPASAWDGNLSLAPASPTIYLSSTRDVQIRNTTIYDTHGITIHSERTGAVMQDQTVRRVIIHKPDRFIAGHPASDGRYYQDRHCWEAKAGQRILIEGLRCSGNWADWTPAGQAMLFATRGAAGNDLSQTALMTDVTLRGSILDRTASGIMISGDPPWRNSAPIQRIRITNNLFQETDFFEHRSSISGVNGLNPSTNFGGAILTLAGTISSLEFTRNTIGLQRGRSAAFIHFIERPGSAFRIEDNVINFSRTGSGVFGLTTERAPQCRSRSGATTFHCMVGAQGERDPDTTFDGNLIYGCADRADQADEAGYDADLGSRGATVSSGQTEAYWKGIESSRPNQFLGDLGSASCGERMDAIFEPGTFQTRPEFAGKGADMDLLASYQGEVGPVSIEKPSADSVVVRYRAPDEEACHVDYSTDAAFATADLTTRVYDGGGQRDRAVTLGGLTPGAGYAYRVLCAAQQPRGVFTAGQ